MAAGVGDIFRAEGSVGGALDFVIDYSSRMTIGRLMSIVERSSNAIVVEVEYGPGTEPNRLFCDFAAGYWSNVPTQFEAAGFAVTLACQAEGDERCLTKVSWTDPAPTDDMADDARRRRDLLYIRFEELQAMAAELAAAEDVADVLDVIVARAGTAVLAPRFLIAVKVSDHEELRVHHRGFPDDATAEQVAAQVLSDKTTGSTVAVDVASGRQHFGKIAAIYPAGITGSDVDRRLMAAYAGHAAAALAAAAAMERARRDRDTATALLDLAHALSRVGTPDDVARRLAEALQAVAESDAASVWFWEPDVERLRQASTHPAEVADLLPSSISTTGIVGLEQVMADPRPTLLDADQTAFLLGTDAAERFPRIAAIPIVARGTFLGFVAAGFESVIHDDEVALLDRLAGFADQAATALDNAQLVAHIRHQADHDPLTGLPNRLLVAALGAQLLDAEASNGCTGVLFLDIDRFKNINDSFGHRVGDDVLRRVVDRLREATRANDLLARLGGDEFVVVVTDVEDEAAVTVVANRLLASLHTPFDVGGQQVFLSCSIGIALAHHHAVDYETLMQHADAAMYEAKALGRNTFAVHTPAAAGSRLDALELESALHLAIKLDQLSLVYQPQVDLRSMEVVGVEALVRWYHPDWGTIGPDRFIPLAEESDVIVDIDRWVRRTAFAQARAWRDAGHPPLRMSLNLSTRELRDPSLPEQLRSEISRFGLDPSSVELEVTERVVMAEEDLPAILSALVETGVRLAIDDFGTGTSVLGRLQHCPVDTLKIDKSFVAEITSTSSGAIVAALVQMGRSLDLDVVAEGVETPIQAGVLRELGCHLAQGYLFSRPVPPGAIEELCWTRSSDLGRSDRLEPPGSTSASTTGVRALVRPGHTRPFPSSQR